jgi:hypothetical protein
LLNISVLFAPKTARDSVRIASDDELLHLEAGRGATVPMASIIFKDPALEKPLLRELCFILRVIDAFVPKYDLWNYQCYWFCHTIMRILEMEYEPKGALCKTHEAFKKAGTFFGIPIRRENKATKIVQRGIRLYYQQSKTRLSPYLLILAYGL